MSRTLSLIKIAGVLFPSVVLVAGSSPSAAVQPDPREHEESARKELQELAGQRARLEAELAEVEAAEHRLREQRGEGIRGPDERGPHEHSAITQAQLEDEIHALRLEESNLRATAEQLELSSRLVEARDVHRQLVQLRHEIELREFELTRLHREAERRELAMMTDRLDYVDNWHNIAFDPHRAVMMATQTIVEVSMASTRRPEQAVEVLEQLLERIEERGARTAIRFALRDVYMAIDAPERAIEHMVQVIVENSGGAR